MLFFMFLLHSKGLLNLRSMPVLSGVLSWVELRGWKCWHKYDLEKMLSEKETEKEPWKSANGRGKSQCHVRPKVVERILKAFKPHVHVHNCLQRFKPTELSKICDLSGCTFSYSFNSSITACAHQTKHGTITARQRETCSLLKQFVAERSVACITPYFYDENQPQLVNIRCNLSVHSSSNWAACEVGLVLAY